MDTHLQVAKWLRTLGYDGEIPENLDKLCLSSTSFIWDQLIQNTRSKIEIENMKNNILVHRLQEHGLNINKVDKFQYPQQEIITYSKKCDLEESLLNTNYSITEKQRENQNLIQQNKIKRFSIERLNLKIKENQEREFLLQSKLKIIDKDLQDAEDIFKLSVTCDIFECSETVNSKDITQTLQKCEEELEEKVKELPLSTKNSLKDTTRLLYSTQKSVRKNNRFEQYLTLTEKKTSKKTKTHAQNKENIGPNKIHVRLFSDDDDDEKVKPEKMCASNKKNFLEIHSKDNDYDNFLVDLSKASFLAPLPSCKIPVHSENERGNFVMKESVMNDVLRLFRKYNRESIWNIFYILDDNAHFRISKKINFQNVHLPSFKNIKLEDFPRLQSLHVKTEFLTLKNNIMLKQLNENVNKKKDHLTSSLIKSGYPANLLDSLQGNFKLQIEDVGLDCLLEVMKKEINSIQNSSTVTDISVIKKHLLEVKEVINLKRKSIIQCLEMVQDIFMDINRIRNSTSFCVRKLSPFTSDLTWSNLLGEDITTHEIKTFEDFPLEYNRKFINTDPSIFYKDLHTNKFLCNREIENENLNMLSDILGSPFSAPETVILNILRTKLKLDILNSIKSVENKTHGTYSLKDLYAQESYMENVLQQLNTLIESSTSKKTLSAANISRKIMDIWIEMPFKDVICPSRTFEGKDFKAYDKMFDSFYNSL